MALLWKTLVSSSLVASCSAARLFAATEHGSVSSIALTGPAADGTYGLQVTAQTAECGNSPSVLTLDYDHHVLYCYDNGGKADASGGLNSFSIADDGRLTRIAHAAAPCGGVWGEILKTPNRGNLYITASYSPGAVSVIQLAADGTLPAGALLQTILPTIEATGPVQHHQDASHLHQVIIDPTGAYVLFLDLGGDRVRVFKYDNATTSPPTTTTSAPSAAYSAAPPPPLLELEPLRTAAGAGPRHGAFRVNAAGETFFFYGGYLSQKIYAYKVAYGEHGLTWQHVFEAPAMGLNSAPAPLTAPTNELVLSPDGHFLIVSSFDNSESFLHAGPSDTLSTWAVADDGTLAHVQNAPSGGFGPRQFALSRAGDRLAVGHEKGRATVVVWRRDPASGALVAEDRGGKLGEVELTGPVVMTVWDD